jgi:starvation-inducible DNA-binding protein
LGCCWAHSSVRCITLWQEHYEALTENIDALAVANSDVGGYPSGTAVKASWNTLRLAKMQVVFPTRMGWIENLVSDITSRLSATCAITSDQCGEKYHDQGTADFLTGLMEQHEEMAWMLRSFIEGQSIDPDGRLSAEGMRVPVEMK